MMHNMDIQIRLLNFHEIVDRHIQVWGCPYQLFQNGNLNFDFTVVKTPFALLQIQLKMLFA